MNLGASGELCFELKELDQVEKDGEEDDRQNVTKTIPNASLRIICHLFHKLKKKYNRNIFLKKMGGIGKIFSLLIPGFEHTNKYKLNYNSPAIFQKPTLINHLSLPQ